MDLVDIRVVSFLVLLLSNLLENSSFFNVFFAPHLAGDELGAGLNSYGR